MAAGDPGTRKRNYSATAIETTLVNAMTSAATGDVTTSVAVVSASGFPATVPFTLILGPDTSKEEVVTVTAIAGTTLTIVRGQDNTQAQSHAAGSTVRHGVSAREFKELQTHIAARGYDADTAILSGVDTHVHGLVSGDGSIVGSDQSVTLTRKTLTTPTINGATITGTVTASTATIASPTITSPTISGSPVITGLSSSSMSTSSATPKSYVDALITTNEAYATAAATSATSAATSATSAATSATSAAASATTAAASVATIAGYSSNASTQATAAATSATSAATSATSAATSATSAAASATTASASAATATTQAGNASSSATAAATSATSAAASATASATSAGQAATSASSAATSATSAATSATSAATTYTSYDQRYLGSKTSAPSVDNQGNALITGATYWNSTSSIMYAWSGSAWSAISTTTSYSAPTLGSTTIASGATVSTISALTLNNGTLTGTLTAGASSGTNGQYLQSTGTGVQWGTVSSYSAPTIGSTSIASGSTVTTINGLTKIVSATVAKLDASGYEQDFDLLTIMGAI